MPLDCKDISRSASHTLASMARSGSRGAATSSAASASTGLGMDFADKGNPSYSAWGGIRKAERSPLNSENLIRDY
ncbi:hypothetical protein PaelaDRAFT_2021 [Paenibacillus lactis 154]|uniref:Uncharacterized protein n=1 Tax=Paenibacillus lactis 154 TaxID=743719 RepID=G4HDG8_9BACL|nr:hypothetical protein PaelaDRAFT_2021 [Paenibacillus lactis 154]